MAELTRPTDSDLVRPAKHLQLGMGSGVISGTSWAHIRLPGQDIKVLEELKICFCVCLKSNTLLTQGATLLL